MQKTCSFLGCEIPQKLGAGCAQWTWDMKLVRRQPSQPENHSPLRTWLDMRSTLPSKRIWSNTHHVFFPPMVSSAQNSSGVHWCRRRVRFNQVLQPRIAPVCTGAGAGSGSTRFWRRFRRFQRRSGRLWCRARSGSTGFRRRFRRRSGRLWCRARSGSTGFRRRFRRRLREALVQSQVRFNRVPEKVPEKVWKLWCTARSGSTAFRSRFRRRSGRLWCRARSGSTGFRRRFRRRSGRLWRRARSGSTRICGHLIQRNPAEVFQRLALQHASERFVKKTLRLWGIPPKLIFSIDTHYIALRFPDCRSRLRFALRQHRTSNSGRFQPRFAIIFQWGYRWIA